MYEVCNLNLLIRYYLSCIVEKKFFYFYIFIQGPFEVKGDSEFGHEKVPFKWRNRIAKKVNVNIPITSIKIHFF